MRLPLGLEIELRAAARRVGLPRAYFTVRRALGGGRRYEPAFNEALRAGIRPGDVVWDVGANVGRYTMLFSEWVGPHGHVVAFEPAPAAFKRLWETTRDRPNVTRFEFALGTTSGATQIYIASEVDSGTHSLSPIEPGRPAVEVGIESGDRVVIDRGVPAPNIVKIDVEGWEFDVLVGLDATLRVPRCRVVACEVHFGVLAAKGQKHQPRKIERFLQDRGFNTRWTDASHLLAMRQ